MAVDRNKLIASAQKNLQRGQVQKALRDYETIAAAFPDDIRILLKIGDLQAREGLFDKAVRTYNEVSDYYVANGFFLKAVAVYKQLLRIKPEDVGAQMRLADLYAQLGLFSDSLAQYSQVAQQLHASGQSGPYLQVLKRMVELDPSRVGNRIKLAEQYLKLSDVENAVGQFEAACDTLEAEGRFEEFIKVAERMMNQRASDVSQIKRLARVYVEVGKPQNAIGVVLPLFRTGSYDHEAVQLLVDAMEHAGQVDRAKTILRELIPIFDAHERPRELRQAWELLSRLDPSDTEARRFLHGDEAELLEFELVLDGDGLTDEERATVERMLSETDVYMKYNLHEKALAHLAQILAIEPASIPAISRRAEVHEAAGNRLMAGTDLAQLIQLLAASGDSVEDIPDLLARLVRTDPDPTTLATAQATAARVAGDVHEIEDFELIDDDDDPAATATSAALGEFDALFGETAEDVAPVGGDFALDQDEDFIREIENSWSAPVGSTAATDADTVTLAAQDFLPAELDEQLERASALAAAGELSDAQALLLELMGDWPEHAEAILRTLDELPSSTEAVNASSDLPAVQPASPDLGSLFDDEDDDDTSDAFELEFDLGDEHDERLVLDDIEPDELLDLVDFSAGSSGSFVATGTDASASVGRVSDGVIIEFGPSVAALAATGSAFSEAIEASRDGRLDEAFELFQDQLFGDHPVAASFELARLRVVMGEFTDAAGALQALENAPGLSQNDIALIRYHRSICYEAMGDVPRAREIWQVLIRTSLSVFPDLPIRLARTS